MSSDQLWKLRIVLIIGGIVSLVYGTFNVFTSLTNTSVTKLKYSEYCDKRPNAKWLELEDAWVDFRDAVEIQTVKDLKKKDKAGNVLKSEYYAPIWKEHDGEETCVAFLKCNDSGSIELARQGSGVRVVSDEQLEKWYAANDKRMFLNRTVKGLVIYGLNADAEDRRLLNKAAGGKLDSNFVIIDENAQPQGGVGLLLLLVGMVMLAGSGATFLIKPQTVAQPVPTRHGQRMPAGPRAARPGVNRPGMAPVGSRVPRNAQPQIVSAPQVVAPPPALTQPSRPPAMRPSSNRTVSPPARSNRTAPPARPQAPPPREAGPRMPRKRPHRF